MLVFEMSEQAYLLCKIAMNKMGIYTDNGIEYIIVLPHTNLCLVHTRDSNDRLVQSEYYKSRESEWCNVDVWSYREPIYPDFPLTTPEYDLLQSILTVHGDDVVSHGWYEVNYVFTTHRAELTADGVCGT